MFNQLFEIAKDLAADGKTETEIRQALFRVKGARVAGIASVMRVVEALRLTQEKKGA